MFTPVSAAEVFETTAGRAFLDRFGLEADNDPLGIRWMDSKLPAYSREPVSPELVEANLLRCANWLTGNYSDETGLCTLYRAIDPPMLKDLEKTGAFVSRTVQVFGPNDVPEAEAALRRAAEGTVDAQTRARIERLMLLTSSRRLTRLDETKDLLAGVPSEYARNRLLRTADVLGSVLAGGEEGYRAIVKRASNDDTTPETPGSLEALTHPSIHLSTDLDFVRKLAGYSSLTHVVKVEFEPGSIPVAPNVGIIGDELITEKYVDLGLDEAEWYGIGKLDLNSPGVHSYSIEKFA